MRDDAARAYAEDRGNRVRPGTGRVDDDLGPDLTGRRVQQPARSMMPSGKDFMALEDVAAVAAGALDVALEQVLDFDVPEIRVVEGGCDIVGLEDRNAGKRLVLREPLDFWCEFAFFGEQLFKSIEFPGTRDHHAAALP